MPHPLSGLPGSEPGPGAGPVSPALLEALFDDAALLAVPEPDLTASLDRHRRLRAEPAGELLLGPLLVPAGRVEALTQALLPGDHALPVVLVPDPGPGPAGPREAVAQLAALRTARYLLLDDDRVQPVGVVVALPGGTDPGAAARAVVDALDFTVPAWLRPAPGDDGAGLLEVLAEDGAEGLALPAAGPDALPDRLLAALLRAAVDRELTIRATGGPLPLLRPPAGVATDGPGALNLLCAVRAALNGAETAELTEILVAVEPGPLLSAVRGMSDADAAVVRAFLAAVPLAPIASALVELDDLALLPADVR
ncbi:MAG TPA: hypothetical protein VFP72_19885 [Kineosporiaceae bacterium]|nr:hypothetical protein [Kineosporiaceae bacterium]